MNRASKMFMGHQTINLFPTCPLQKIKPWLTSLVPLWSKSGMEPRICTSGGQTLVKNLHSNSSSSFNIMKNWFSQSTSNRKEVNRERKMEGIKHRMVMVNGINMHIAEKGEGPVVLFLHGFPELWYAWRHQIVALAAHGYHAVAPDLRGYGDTDAPTSPSSYSALCIVGDLVAFIDSLGQEQVFVVGHDWGAIIAWHLCLFRPDRVKALVNMSVAFQPRNPLRKPVQSLLALHGDDYYICRFQEPGVAEAEFASGSTAGVLKMFLTYRNPGPLIVPKEVGFGVSADTPFTIPSWLSEEDINYYASKFDQKGFTGGLNYYRALDLTWELTAPWTGAQVKVPVKFIVGDLDLTYNGPGVKEFIHGGGLKKYVPFLKEVVVMEGVGHFINEEKADEISKHIYDFIQEF